MFSHLFEISLLISSVIYQVNCQTCRLTTAAAEGPFFKQGAPLKNTTVCDAFTPTNKLVVSGRVMDATCQKGIQALLDVWQANRNGVYSDGRSSFECRTKIFTDPQGYYSFSTSWPVQYSVGGGRFRPAHIHYKVYAYEAGYKALTTQMYFQNDTLLGANDPCPDCRSGDPTLTILPALAVDGRSFQTRFNIVMRKS